MPKFPSYSGSRRIKTRKTTLELITSPKMNRYTEAVDKMTDAQKSSFLYFLGGYLAKDINERDAIVNEAEHRAGIK